MPKPDYRSGLPENWGFALATKRCFFFPHGRRAHLPPGTTGTWLLSQQPVAACISFLETGTWHSSQWRTDTFVQKEANMHFWGQHGVLLSQQKEVTYPKYCGRMCSM